MGNFLREGTAAGKAGGFRLDTAVKLESLKKEHTLLHRGVAARRG